jgi:hypothetical protein
VDLRQLFTDYAAASTSGEPSRVAAFYSPNGFLVAGPEGSAVFANDGAFLDWLRGVREFNTRSGLQSMDVDAVDETPIGAHYTLATVRWSARFEKTGAEPIRFSIGYLLQMSNTPLIVGYISHEDQLEVMRRFDLA